MNDRDQELDVYIDGIESYCLRQHNFGEASRLSLTGLLVPPRG